MEPIPRGDSPDALATFGFLAGPRIGEELPVPAPDIIIGQGSQADLVLDDDSVSKRHARLEYDPAGWRLTDLGSTNGTFVEGVRLAPEVPTPLPYGSSVRFGGVRLQFRAYEDADLEAARAVHAERPTPKEPAAPRRLRLPVWLFLLILLVLAVLGYFLFAGAGPEPAAPAVEAVSLLGPPPPPALPGLR